MYASIRDGTLLSGGFSSISEGLQALGIASVELGIDREYRLNAINRLVERRKKDERIRKNNGGFEIRTA
ncbi:MAG: hypothetical protein H8D67_08475 [Deltaproteobacteria bacterium]|nr:hypothetical protein [Deltaproteobacteria bacterium]